MPIFSSCAFGAPIAGFFGHSTRIVSSLCCKHHVPAPIRTFFGTLVQPCPRTKRNDVIKAILNFRFQDRWAGKKRQQAYNVAQKACSTLFLNTPMATLCEFIRQAAIMARQDREVRYLPHEFLLMQPVVRARWAAQLPRTRALLQHAYFLSFTAPTNLHCPVPEVPDKPKKRTPNKPPRERVDYLSSDIMTNVYAEWVSVVHFCNFWWIWFISVGGGWTHSPPLLKQPPPPHPTLPDPPPPLGGLWPTVWGGLASKPRGPPPPCF